jgi:hypothetical protein
MKGRKIRYSGQHSYIREVDDRELPLNQDVTMEMSDDMIDIEIVGKLSGGHRGIVSRDPVILDHYRRLDRAQVAAEIAERPAQPEPERLRIGEVPDGARECWICRGSGMAELTDGLWAACVNCRGVGYLWNAEHD